MKAWLKDKLELIKADLKKAWMSMTIWFGMICEVAIEYLPEITKAVSESEEYMLPETYKRIMQGIVLINMLLRFRTTKALRHK